MTSLTPFYRAASLMLLAALFCSPASSAKAEGFTYRGKSIEPICLAAFADQFTGHDMSVPDVLFAECKQGYVVSRSQHSNGLTTSLYRDNKSANAAPDASIAYRHLGRIGDAHALWIQYNPGGSGFFSSVSLIKVNGDALQFIRQLATGDRCGGRFQKAEIKGGKLYYTQRITPFDLISQSAMPGLEAVDYSDFEGSSTVCLASGDFVGEGLTAVTLDASVEELRLPETGEAYPHQACFQDFYQDWRQKYGKRLDRAGIASFTRNFLSQCITAKT